MKNEIYICCQRIQSLPEVSDNLKNSFLMLKVNQISLYNKSKTDIVSASEIIILTNCVSPAQTVPKAVESDSHFAQTVYTLI